MCRQPSSSIELQKSVIVSRCAGARLERQSGIRPPYVVLARKPDDPIDESADHGLIKLGWNP